LLALAIGTASATTAFAQTITNSPSTTPAAPADTNTPASTPPAADTGGRQASPAAGATGGRQSSPAAGDTGGRQSSPAAGDTGGRQSVLTADEKTQLKKDRDAALVANPDLKTEADNLSQQREKLKNEGDSASKDDWQALKTQSKAHEVKMRAAMLQIDPTLAAIYAKLDAAQSGGRQ